MIKGLAKHFTPAIKHALINLELKRFEFEVRETDHKMQGNDKMFHFVVTPKGQWFLDEFDLITLALNKFCSCEDLPVQMADELYYTLGDGDDGLAVWFQDGSFYIWLRGWEHNWANVA